MTGTASDGAGPTLTRAERRRKQSWIQRRRARKTARRRTTGRSAESTARGERAPAPAATRRPTTVPERPTPVEVAPPARPVAAAPMVAPPVPPRSDAAGADAGAPTVSRRERRSGPAPSRRAGRARDRRAPRTEPIAVTAPPAPVEPAPAPRPAPAREVEPAGAPAPDGPQSRPRRGSRDRRFWTRVVPAIAAALVVAVVVGVVLRSGDDDTPTGGGAAAPGVPVDQLPVLFVHQGTSGTDLIAVADADGNRGSVLFVPTATQLDVPSEGVTILGDIPTADGGARLTNSVENVLGVAIGKTVILDDAALTAALGPAAPLPITLPKPVEFTDRDGTYRAGAQQVSAAQASELVGAPQDVNELDRLVVAATVIGGWMDRLREPAVAQATLGVLPGLAPLVEAAEAKDRRLDTAPVASIATGGDERFNMRTDEITKVIRRAFPKAQLGIGGRRPRVEILNGTGALGVAQAVADKVVPAGGRFTRSDNLPGFGLQATQVVYYADEWRASAQRILDAMGCGSLRRAGQDVHVADVTILVGADCPAYGAPGGGT